MYCNWLGIFGTRRAYILWNVCDKKMASIASRGNDPKPRKIIVGHLRVGGRTLFQNSQDQAVTSEITMKDPPSRAVKFRELSNADLRVTEVPFRLGAVPGDQGSVFTNYASEAYGTRGYDFFRSVEMAAHIKDFKIALTTAHGILVKNVLVRHTAAFRMYQFHDCKAFGTCQVRLSAVCLPAAFSPSTIEPPGTLCADVPTIR
ncbi:hypothetical protein IW261DRAFT_1414745 [Armillaria novae-zelandiae]|uniref:Uncharacterized protein n=1 Tax=Armillaria novae-zelandiae TaxID=153914 RepID=A0AA39PTK4_9AGAR|nr:hypothetical protein IW261DRAFT_1414745 [Armillaria novae-zelandiae]